MSADQVGLEELSEHLQELVQHVRALDTHAPAELVRFLASSEMGDEARRAVKAVAALQIVDMPHHAAELAPLLAHWRSTAPTHLPDAATGALAMQVKYAGAALKVSVSMPRNPLRRSNTGLGAGSSVSTLLRLWPGNSSWTCSLICRTCSLQSMGRCPRSISLRREPRGRTKSSGRRDPGPR